MNKWIGICAVLALAGCSGKSADAGNATENAAEPAAQSAAASSKACDVLTQADAQKALGRPVKQMHPSGGAAGYDICQYGYEGEKMMDSGNVSVTLHDAELASMKKGVADEGYHAEPVQGLGDQAFWSPEAGLYVGKGNRTAIYMMGIGGASDEQNKERAIDLARGTASRI